MCETAWFVSISVRLQIHLFQATEVSDHFGGGASHSVGAGTGIGWGTGVGVGVILVLLCLIWEMMAVKLKHHAFFSNFWRMDYRKASPSIFVPQIYRNGHTCRNSHSFMNLQDIYAYIVPSLHRIMNPFGHTTICTTNGHGFKYPSHLRLWFSSACCSHRASRFVTSLWPAAVVHKGPGGFCIDFMLRITRYRKISQIFTNTRWRILFSWSCSRVMFFPSVLQPQKWIPVWSILSLKLLTMPTFWVHFLQLPTSWLKQSLRLYIQSVQKKSSIFTEVPLPCRVGCSN